MARYQIFKSGDLVDIDRSINTTIISRSVFNNFFEHDYKGKIIYRSPRQRGGSPVYRVMVGDVVYSIYAKYLTKKGTDKNETKDGK